LANEKKESIMRFFELFIEVAESIDNIEHALHLILCVGLIIAVGILRTDFIPKRSSILQ